MQALTCGKLAGKSGRQSESCPVGSRGPEGWWIGGNGPDLWDAGRDRREVEVKKLKT